MSIKYLDGAIPNNFSIPSSNSGLKQEDEVTYQGKTYYLLGQSKETLRFHSRVWLAVYSFVKTFFTLGFLYSFEKFKQDWKISWNGKRDVILYNSHIPTIKNLADQGQLYAQIYMRNIYLSGKGVDRSDEEAFKYTQLAANQGYTPAQYVLGKMYETGTGIKAPSYVDALKQYELAAKNGCADAQYSIGMMCYYGKGTNQSYKEAFHYFELAAKQEHIGSLCNIGFMFEKGHAYENGQGPFQSDSKALHYYQLAAQKGDATALCNLGIMFEFKKLGVERSYSKAAQYYQLAAEKNHPEAYYRLGFLYEKGYVGPNPSNAEASKHYQKAVSLGHPTAQKDLDRLNGK